MLNYIAKPQKTLLIFLLSLMCMRMVAQDYFTNWYCGGYLASNISSLHQVDDALYATGFCQVGNISGIVFYKMDTLGQVLVQEEFIDPELGSIYGNHEVALLDDSTLLITAPLKLGGSLILTKRLNGPVINRFVNKDPELNINYTLKVVKHRDHIYILQIKRKVETFTTDLIKMDASLNQIWVKKYIDTKNAVIQFNDLITVDDGHLALYNNTEFRLITIDGETVFTKAFEKRPNGNDVAAMFVDANGNYQYINNSILDFRGDVVHRPTLGSNDQDFTNRWEEWYEEVPLTYTFVGRFTDLKPAKQPDANIAVGGLINIRSFTTYYFDYPDIFCVYLTQINQNGEQMWRLRDTLFNNQYNGHDLRENQLMIAPSGSIYVYGGSYYNNSIVAYGSCGYIAKYNSRGCQDASCEGVIYLTTTTEEVAPPTKSPTSAIYPNPTGSEGFELKLDDGSSTSPQVEVIDIKGKSIYMQKLESGGSPYHIPTEHIESGIYFVLIHNDHQVIAVHKLIISK